MTTENDPPEDELLIATTRRAYLAWLKGSYGLSLAALVTFAAAVCTQPAALPLHLGLWLAQGLIGLRLAFDIRLFALFLDLPEARRECVVPAVLRTLLGARAPAARLTAQIEPYARERGACRWLTRQAGLVAVQIAAVMVYALQR